MTASQILVIHGSDQSTLLQEAKSLTVTLLPDGSVDIGDDNQRLRCALHGVQNELLGQGGELAEKIRLWAAWGLTSQEEQEAMQ